MIKLALNLPINNLSLGQTSTLLLRTLFEREKAGDKEIDWYVLPISQVDLSCQQENKEFLGWLQQKINKSIETYSRDIPVFKIWHLNGSLESFGRKQALLTFYELDRPTKIELNIARNNSVYLSSSFACDVFKSFGVETSLLPLSFDSYNFNRMDKKFHEDERIVFNLCGKMEKRKHHIKIIQTWIKKFGNNPKYSLQCAVMNPFLNEQQNNQMCAQSVNGQKPFNVNFYPMMKENSVYNEFINSADIILGMSGGEGWGLPEFHSVALGKHAVILNAHSYKTWATEANVTFVNPNSKIDSSDGVFFQSGQAFNQGNLFDWDENEFIAACETAIKKSEANKLNSNGLLLQKSFTKEMFADGVTNAVKKLL